jgi:hypothetical protein
MTTRIATLPLPSKVPAMTVRFSKKSLRQLLESNMARYEELYEFKTGDGWSVVDNKPRELCISFGHYDAWRALLEDLK